MAASFLDAYNAALAEKVKASVLAAHLAIEKNTDSKIAGSVKTESCPGDTAADHLSQSKGEPISEATIARAGISVTYKKYRSIPKSEHPKKKLERKHTTPSNSLIIKSLLPSAGRVVINKSKLKPSSIYKVPRYPHLQAATPTKPLPQSPEIRLEISSDAEFVWDAGFGNAFKLLEINELEGIQVQFPGQAGRGRDIVMGLDFGTSSVKLVLGDRGAGKAYAVPFMDASGVNGYLLPSRVFETAGVFSLTKGVIAHRDLKLRFLAGSFDCDVQETLVGFLALVIRRCRAWLFREHADSFANRTLLWKLVLGRAIDRAVNDEVGQVMGRVLASAWAVAGEAGMVSRTACAKALMSIQGQSEFNSEALEVSVVPELAAQIYGFVMSRQFDVKAKNIYLIVDVGAGSVDVSLFRVKSTDIGTWDFSLFTSVVEPNGVINLHRTRLKWWHQQLAKNCYANVDALIEKLKSISVPTEQIHPIPEHYDGYFRGLQATFFGGAVNPDEDFYMNRLVLQVRGHGIQKPVNSRIVGKIDIANLPFFLCGGGSRLPLYKNLSLALHKASNFRWLESQRRELGVPSDLVASGLAQSDYDRLSVAYGLSFVDVGNVAVAQAMPAIYKNDTVDWRSNYHDKDQC